ncbi:MAG: CbiX/SirB N-terminal domain-containing protein [Ramlibacter sp.]
MTRAIVLFGHGSRDPSWRAPMDAVVQRINDRQPGVPVVCAFLEFPPPGLSIALQEVVDRGANRILVLPMFLGVGKHARDDLPLLVAQVRDRHPAIAIEVLTAVGERPEVLDLLADIALKQL